MIDVQREPYRLFFPLGLLISWLGVSHWFWYGYGLAESYSGLSHALILTQAMLLTFVFGFLMTALPRRTDSRPAHPVELVLAFGSVVVTAVAAQLREFMIAELAFCGGLFVLAVFIMWRIVASPGRRPPNSFLLLPFGCGFGVAGAGLIIRMMRGAGTIESYLLGRELAQQGAFLCFSLGAGALIIPLIRGTPPPPDMDGSRRQWLARLGFVAAGIALLASFLWEQQSPRWALVGRAAVVLIVAVVTGAAGWPRLPGLHRRFVVVSMWMTPAGLLAAATFRQHAVAGLHLMFIGGLSLMVFGVAAHVSLGHGGRQDLMARRPWRAVAFGGLLALALALRVSAHRFPSQYFLLLAVASALWIAGTVAWALLVVPALGRS